SNDETASLAWDRLQIDMPGVRHDDAPGDSEAETRAALTLREERLKDPPLLLRWDARAGIGDGNPHFAVLLPHLEPQAPLASHGFYRIHGNVPEHLGELIGIEGKARHARLHLHLDLHAASRGTLPRDCVGGGDAA